MLQYSQIFESTSAAVDAMADAPPLKKRKVCEIKDDEVTQWVTENIGDLYNQRIADASAKALDGYTGKALSRASLDDIKANLVESLEEKLLNKVSRTLYNCIHPELQPSFAPWLRLLVRR